MWARVLLIAALAAVAQGRQAAAQAEAALNARLAAIAAQHHGQVALFGENLKTHETVALAADQVVPTASVIKLAILYEALEQIRAGSASFGDRIVLAPDDRVGGSGLLQFFDAPLDLTFKDV